VGVPFRVADLINALVYRFKFPDRSLSPLVRCARQALALDDERHSFHPLLWCEADGDRIQQVWFSGAHSNVGGGYPKQGLSLVALDWMMAEARQAGLRFHADDETEYANHASVDDKLYDPRSGPGCLYRWKPRHTAAMCRERQVVPRVHISVVERIAHGTDDYGPGNLMPGAGVVFTHTGHSSRDAATALRARAAQAALRRVHGQGQSLLDGVRWNVRLGRLSHLVSLVLAPLAALAPVTPEWTIALWSGLGLSLLTGRVLRRRRRDAFSRFWHPAQQELRQALKHAQQHAQLEQAPSKAS
jgi:hypothetical protein